MGEVVLALQAVQNPTPGIVEASLAEDGAQRFRVRLFDIKSPYDDDWKAKVPHHADDEEGDGTTTSDPTRLVRNTIRALVGERDAG